MQRGGEVFSNRGYKYIYTEAASKADYDTYKKVEDSYYNGTHYPGKFTEEEEEEINRSIYIGADSAPRYHQKKIRGFLDKRPIRPPAYGRPSDTQ